jgi:hypothetical protein
MDHEDLIVLAEARLRLKQLAPDTDCPRDELGVFLLPDEIGAKSRGLRHGTASGLMRLAMGMEPATAPSPKQFASPRGSTFPADIRVR